MSETKSELCVGSSVRVRKEFLTRGGQSGEVVEVFDSGVSVDFYCDVFGDPSGLPTIEFWEFEELE